MAEQNPIHVFQCVGGAAYGFTSDRSGGNLPEAECPDGWEFLKTLESEPFDLPRVAADPERVRIHIARKGYAFVPWTIAPG